jgi:hypothetical protein
LANAGRYRNATIAATITNAAPTRIPVVRPSTK